MHIERKVAGLDYKLNQTNNLLVETKEGWQLQLDDGTVIPVPERQGKELFVLMKAVENFVRNRKGEFPDTLLPTFDHHVLSRAECHTLLARLIADFPKEHTDVKNTMYINLFSSEKYHEYSFEEVLTELYSAFPEGEIIVQQYIGDDEFVTHTALLIRGKSDMYILEKTGDLGPLFFTRLEKKVFEATKVFYGRKMAFLDLQQVLDSDVVKKHWDEPRLKAI